MKIVLKTKAVTKFSQSLSSYKSTEQSTNSNDEKAMKISTGVDREYVRINPGAGSDESDLVRGWQSKNKEFLN